MRDGGTLTVTLEVIGNDWEISFADTGPGMSPQMVEKVFEPFQSQFEGGTGLGLAIVYQIVQGHDGKVWARSKLGQGCEFVLRLRHLGAEEEISPTQGEAISQSQPMAAGAAAAIGGQAHG